MSKGKIAFARHDKQPPLTEDLGTYMLDPASFKFMASVCMVDMAGTMLKQQSSHSMALEHAEDINATEVQGRNTIARSVGILHKRHGEHLHSSKSA